jgi:hypothetical protein
MALQDGAHPALQTMALGHSVYSKDPRQTGLPDDAQQSTGADGIVERNRNRNGCPLCPLLHDTVTAALARREETVLFANLANLQA